jgi:hypothetical protein
MAPLSRRSFGPMIGLPYRTGGYTRPHPRQGDDRGPSRLCSRRGGRVVEGARLERVYTGNRIEGSNPSLSAS